jgi:hypothetical protein
MIDLMSKWEMERERERSAVALGATVAEFAALPCQPPLANMLAFSSIE